MMHSVMQRRLAERVGRSWQHPRALHKDSHHGAWYWSIGPQQEEQSVHVCCTAEEARERKLEMANPDSAMRSVRTSSRTRVLYGIGIAIVGGEASQLIL